MPKLREYLTVGSPSCCTLPYLFIFEFFFNIFLAYHFIRLLLLVGSAISGVDEEAEMLNNT
jgi:hypothetical protein